MARCGHSGPAGAHRGRGVHVRPEIRARRLLHHRGVADLKLSEVLSRVGGRVLAGRRAHGVVREGGRGEVVALHGGGGGVPGRCWEHGALLKKVLLYGHGFETHCLAFLCQFAEYHSRAVGSSSPKTSRLCDNMCVQRGKIANRPLEYHFELTCGLKKMKK